MDSFRVRGYCALGVARSGCFPVFVAPIGVPVIRHSVVQVGFPRVADVGANRWSVQLSLVLATSVRVPRRVGVVQELFVITQDGLVGNGGWCATVNRVANRTVCERLTGD